MSELVLISKEELQSLMNDISEIKQMLKGNVSGGPEQAITVKEAAAFLGINRHTLYKRIRYGHYPKEIIHQHGKRHVFYKSELCNLIKGKRLARP